MKANKESLDVFLKKENTQFVIPIYQRNYNWEEKHCKQLLNDIKKAGKEKKTHFIGSIVFIGEDDDVYRSRGEIKKLTIIDGQQRLTTIMLIYLVLYRLYNKMENTKRAEEILKKYIKNEDVKDEYKIKLRPAEEQNKAFEFLINEKENEYDGYSQLNENFTFFKNNILENDSDTIYEGLHCLVYVFISLDREKDNPQKIFESMNSTGLDLSQADLIRNYILMNLEFEKQKEIYKNYWKVIEEWTKDEEKNEMKTADFIRDFLTSKNKKIPNKTDVYKNFKTTYPQLKNDNLDESLAPIKNLSQYYYKLINPGKEKDSKISEQLVYIKQLEVNVSYPFLMKIYEDYGDKIISKEIFIEVLKLIQSFVFRRSIIDLPSNVLNKIFTTLYFDVKKDDYLHSIQAALLRKRDGYRFPKDEEFISKLKEKEIYNTKNKKYLLHKLENYNNKEVVKTDNLPVEHIFPKKPDSEWKKDINSGDYTLFEEKYLHTIGNLTFSGNNGALGNKSFLEKKEMNKDGGEQGYKYSRLWLNRFLKEQDKWDIETFEKRLEKIKDRFLKVWKYPGIKIEENNKNNVEKNIFDIEDFTGRAKEIEYFTFYAKRYEFKNYTKLYGTVLKKLFELEPNYFFGNEIEKVLKLTKNKEDIKVKTAVFRISNTYYINTNRNANQLMTILKEVLEIFKFEDELFIKFS